MRFQGIFFTEGDAWHEQRRYALRNLRDFGFGRRFDELELEISDEITQFMDVLKNGPVYEYEKVTPVFVGNYTRTAMISIVPQLRPLFAFLPTEIYEKWANLLSERIRWHVWQFISQGADQRTLSA